MFFGHILGQIYKVRVICTFHHLYFRLAQCILHIFSMTSYWDHETVDMLANMVGTLHIKHEGTLRVKMNCMLFSLKRHLGPDVQSRYHLFIDSFELDQKFFPN